MADGGCGCGKPGGCAGSAACSCGGKAGGCGGGCGGCGTSAADVPATPAPLPQAPRAVALEARRRSWCGTGPQDPRDAGLLTAVGTIRPPAAAYTGPYELTAHGSYPAGGDQQSLAVFQAAERDKRERRAGRKTLLFPVGPCLEPAGQGVLEAGDASVFAGAKPQPAEAVPTAQWQSLPLQLRAMAMGVGFRPAGVSASGAGQPAGPPPPPDHVAGHPAFSPLGGTLPLSNTVSIDDGCACASTYECALASKVVMDYAGAKLCFPARWFWDRHEAGWMSRLDTLDVLYGNADILGSNAPLSDAKMEAMIDCWMIDTKRDRLGRTYDLFFAEGDAPREFLRGALELILRFPDEVKDDWSGSAACVGLGNYLRTVIPGGSAATYSGEVGPCSVRYRATSEDTWLADARVVRACGNGAGVAAECGAYQDTGASFDDWTAVLAPHGFARDDSGYLVPMIHLRVGTEAQNDTTPPAGYFALANIEAGSVQLPANRLAFRGFQLDFVLFWARAALQRFLEALDAKALQTAWVWARSTLVEMIEYSRLMIHELGHVYMGVPNGGHCQENEGCRLIECNCCFDMAAENFKCRVASRLGLGDELYRCYTAPLHIFDPLPCGGTAEYTAICSRERLCEVTDAAVFVAGRCS